MMDFLSGLKTKTCSLGHPGPTSSMARRLFSERGEAEAGAHRGDWNIQKTSGCVTICLIHSSVTSGWTPSCYATSCFAASCRALYRCRMSCSNACCYRTSCSNADCYAISCCAAGCHATCRYKTSYSNTVRCATSCYATSPYYMPFEIPL